MRLGDMLVCLFRLFVAMAVVVVFFLFVGLSV